MTFQSALTTFFLSIALFLSSLHMSAQEDEKQQKEKPKTEKAKKAEEKEEKEEKVSKEMAKANDAFDANEYYTASQLYRKAFTRTKSKKEKVEITFLLGECYRMMQDVKNASNYYTRAIKLKYNDPITHLRLAQMQMQMGEYEDAIVSFQTYSELRPKDQRGKVGIQAAKEAKEWMDNPTRYLVENEKELNTRENDFAITYGGRPNMNDELYFVSDREEATGSKQDGWTGGQFTDIFVTKAERKKKRGRRGSDDGDDMSWSTPVPLGENINTKHHEGPLCFDSRRRTMYFTRCEQEKYEKLGCAIYRSEKRGNDWGEPEYVALAPDSATSVGHPSLSPDDEFLYFASDLEGGHGGRDIWVTTFDRRARAWETPKNLGPSVNSNGDEMFPFAHEDGYLYFASNGLPGMGGLDIFRIKLGEDGMPVGEAENMKYPINTHSNDFAITFEGEGSEKGHLTSDRDGGRGGDDIYSVILAPLVYIIEGKLTSSKDGRPVPMASVRLDGSDGSSFVVTTDKSGFYKFDLDHLTEGTNYTLGFEKKKFLTGTAETTTKGVPLEAHEFVSAENHYLHVIKVNKKIEPIEEPIVLPNVFFDLAKWDLRPEAMTALDSVVTIMDNNPTIVIELRSHTDYRDTDEKNRVLSQKRADTCVKYLASKGVEEDRMVARGMGEDEPFKVPENYQGYGSEHFKPGTVLTEQYIKSLSAELQEVGNQINRRTDFKVLRDDYVPTRVVVTESGEEVKEEINTDPTIHVVEGRESFGKIAQEYDLSIRDLRDLNGGLRGVRPFEGLELKVNPDGDYELYDSMRYRVQMGDNLSKIARELNMKAKDIRDLNDGIKDADLVPGMMLMIE